MDKETVKRTLRFFIIVIVIVLIAVSAFLCSVIFFRLFPNLANEVVGVIVYFNYSFADYIRDGF